MSSTGAGAAGSSAAGCEADACPRRTLLNYVRYERLSYAHARPYRLASAAAAWPGTCSASASPAGSVGAGCDAAACHSGDTRYARRYYAHDATLRYANAVAACGAAAPLQLGAFGHSLSSSRPPGAVVVGVCGACYRAPTAPRARCRVRAFAAALGAAEEARPRQGARGEVGARERAAGADDDGAGRPRAGEAVAECAELEPSSSAAGGDGSAAS